MKLIHWFCRRWFFFKILSMYFCYFIIIPPWKKRSGPSFEQTWILFTQEFFVLSLVEISLNSTEIDPVVLEKKIFKFRQYIFTLLLLSHRGKGRGSSFEQTWIPFTYGCFLRSLVEIGPVVLARRFLNIFNIILTIND